LASLVQFDEDTRQYSEWNIAKEIGNRLAIVCPTNSLGQNRRDVDSLAKQNKVLQMLPRYDTIEEINVDSTVDCDQLNLAHVAGKKYKKRRN